ncbi:hypothetical protein NMY22_g5680 [Coprinellus aureogranulatus]|nr:hypothetical protein NMY22_g5680 [Coprinellus aureogranulatus]
MGPPRRSDPSKSPNKALNGPQYQQPPSTQMQAQQAPPSLGMTTAARYQHNLNVMRRRDPSIQTIFDQFDHVCIYLMEEGGRWQKIGVEGSLFLFESNTYPPYGFYVLNRAGSSDYIQRLYPEDEFGAMGGEIIAIKSYPEYTLKRMAELRSRNGDQPLTNPFSEAYRIPNFDKLTPAVKGEKRTIGIWRLSENEVKDREPMLDVVKRLYGCVRRHEPYPDQFRYGPNHPPPPHRLRATGRRREDGNSSQSDTGVVSDAPSNSEIDALFSKIKPTPTPSAPQTPIDSLFAKLSSDTPAPLLLVQQVSPF